MTDILDEARRVLEGAKGVVKTDSRYCLGGVLLKGTGPCGVCGADASGECGKAGVYYHQLEETINILLSERTGVPALIERVAALEAENERLREALGGLYRAVDGLGLRAIVAGWNGEGRDDGPNDPHHPELRVNLPTNAGTVYAIDAATIYALDHLAKGGSDAE